MWWVVEITYNTDEHGHRLMDPRDYPYVLVGPFKSKKSASKWMNDRPDDTDVHEMITYPLNHPIKDMS